MFLYLPLIVLYDVLQDRGATGTPLVVWLLANVSFYFEIYWSASKQQMRVISEQAQRNRNKQKAKIFC